MKGYDNALGQMRAAGLLVDTLVVDGKVHRCKVEGERERKGWYLLHAWTTSDGHDYVVGSFGIWQGPSNNATKIELARDLMDDNDRAALKQRLADDRKRAAAQRDAEASAAAHKAAQVWAKLLTAPPAGVGADYLERKGVQSYGLRYSPSGAIAVPMQDASGSTYGLQFILPRQHPRVARTGRDKEYWPAGVRKQGRFFQIGAIQPGGVVLVAEGYATAATLHEATGLPVVVAFDAGNLLHVATAIHKAHRRPQVLVCADDDYLQKCRHCGKPTDMAQALCAGCGQEHGAINPGKAAASAAALAVGGAWVAPVFPADRGGKKLTDFNDLHQFPQGGLSLVRAQIEAKLAELGWAAKSTRLKASSAPMKAAGVAVVDEVARIPSQMSIDEAVERYSGIYGMGGQVMFDHVLRRIVLRPDVLNLLPRHGWEALRTHPAWRTVQDDMIGFDPTEKDPRIMANLFGGWPTVPKAGGCDTLLELLYYLCTNEPDADALFQWIVKWLAYPIQHPGAKMQTALVVHGPQGTGKSRFFEAYAKIFGPYGRVLGQEALEDKFNADWAEKKLFILADEVLARQDMYHIKNRLKGFVTGDTIRVNPKNLPARNEKNQMNIVFLSNELQPLALELDDRRHCVVWVPPKPNETVFDAVNAEIEAGGIEALHYHLKFEVDLGDFKPWTKPPVTRSKAQLIGHGLSSEQRFVEEWLRLELEAPDGHPLPVGPCLGTHIYRAYELWCAQNGERTRRMQELIGMLAKRHGWSAGQTVSTWMSLNDPTSKSRKMVVPSDEDMHQAMKLCRHPMKVQERLMRDRYETKGKWLTAGFFAMEAALAPAMKVPML